MASSRTGGGGPSSQSSSASGIFFQGDGQNSQLNSASSISGTLRSTLGPASGDMSRAVQSAANSGPSVGASSLVTDANSALSGGPHLQRSASINTESYMRLPASPISFSSNNISITGSSVVDGSSMVQQQRQQNSNHDQNSQQMQRQQRAASTASSQPTPQAGQVLGAGPPDPNNLMAMQKKLRLDVRQEDILQQQVMQQLLQRQDSFQLQGHNPQLQAFIQQQRLLQQRHQQQQQQIQMQRAQMQQQQQQQQQMLQSMPQLKQHLQQGEQLAPGMKHVYYSGICARRLMQYIYHHRQRPPSPDNSILYWRKFVAEYFAPGAKKRCCLSSYANIGHHALGIFPQATGDVWQCDICGSKSGRGFEITFEVLPRLSKIEFDSGVIDELLFVDLPHECRLPSGLMLLEYRKAVQESIYQQLRVVREGQLRIIFTPDLKILSWEFCARHHEELLPRRLVAPQVTQLLQVAQKHQSAIAESGSTGVASQDLQTNCNMFVTAGRQLARNLELQSVNDMGFSKRYVRCVQISEVVNSMKDLIDFSRENHMGPIESLKNYPRQAVTAAKLQPVKMEGMEQMAHSLTNDQSTLNKLMTMHPGVSNPVNSTHTGIGSQNNPVQAATTALGNYRNLLRQNPTNSNQNAHQSDGSCSVNVSNQAQSMPVQVAVSSVPGSMQIASVNGTLSPRQQPHLLQQNQQSSHSNQHLQQHAIQQLLQEMMTTNGVFQQPLSGHNKIGNAAENMPVKAGAGMLGFGNNSLNMPNNAAAMIPTRSNSFKAPCSNSTAVGGNAFKLRPDMAQNLQLVELVNDIPHDFSESGVFNSEAGDAGYGWKS